MTTLQLGTAKIEITPRAPLPLAGFAARQGLAEGVAQPLFLRVLFFTQDDAGVGERRALLASADLLCWGEDRLPALRRRLLEQWGLGPEAVILSATHTHSAPQTSERLAPSVGRPDPTYVAWLEEQLFVAIARAHADREPVTVQRGAGACRIGINRRKWSDGAIQMAPNADGPVDPELTAVRFRTPAGATKAVLAHYACHPTISQERLVSGEFPGVAMAAVEDALGGAAVAAYLQGCCGEIKAAVLDGDRFARGSAANVRAVGQRLADDVLALLGRPLRDLAACPLAGRHATVELPFQRLPTPADLLAQRRQPGIVGEWSDLLLRQPALLRPSVPLDLTRLDLAAGLSLLAMNGEISVTYGRFVKEATGGRVLPLGYSNGLIGYVVTADQLVEGGYEPIESTRYFGLPAPFAPAIEPRLKEALLALGNAEPR